ncbi:MAG: hypothetical protein EP349_07985 [Alphaproteobacteria bacterium]|nr:MAG: hypothetical protein EP349_07985 [Alphaproteobacteria bacterium]
MLVKLVLGAAAEKAFKKAGGIDGLTEKGKKAAQRLSEHGQNIKKAISHKSVEEGAETVGTVAGDVVDVAKDAGQVTLEIANETLGDLKNGWGRAKEIFGAAKQPKTEDTTAQDDTPYENTASDILQMFEAGTEEAQATGINALVEYLTKGYHFTTEEADKIFEAVESTGLSATDKEKLQEAVIEQTEDTRPGHGFLMSRPHSKKTM